MADHQLGEARRSGGGLCIPLLRLPIPNPLGWVPRPRLLGGGRAKQQAHPGNNRNFASASVAMSESVLTSATSAITSGPPSAVGATAVAGLAASTAPVPTPPTPPPTKVPLKPASDVLCGALARAASQSTIHPLDTLKVRIQARARSGTPGTLPPGVSKFGQLVPPPRGGVPRLAFDPREASKAVASLYRGVFGAASGAGIAIGAYFAFYGAACNVISRNTDMSASGVAFVSGAVAAVGSSFVKVPLAVCIRSVQAGVYPNVFAAARQITTAAGPRGLFTGFLPTLLEDVPDMAIKFAAYESMRQVHSKFHKGRKATPQEDFAMGAVAGSLAAAATTPLDVIKTNMMCTAASRPSMVHAARIVAAQGGLPAFFRGVGPRALSNGINSAVFFAFFEALRAVVANVKRNQAAMTPQQAAAAAGAGGGAVRTSAPTSRHHVQEGTAPLSAQLTRGKDVRAALMQPPPPHGLQQAQQGGVLPQQVLKPALALAAATVHLGDEAGSSAHGPGAQSGAVRS